LEIRTQKIFERHGCAPAWRESAVPHLRGTEMAKQQRARQRDRAETQLDFSHLRRDARTALELAVVALAPWEVIQRLASSAGLLEALSELPADSAPVVALVPKVLTRAEKALKDWQEWRTQHLEARLPRG